MSQVRSPGVLARWCLRDGLRGLRCPEKASAGTGAAGSAHVAGATSGVGSSEIERRVLSLDDVRALLQAQIDDRLTEAANYDGYGQTEAAARLRREAEALTPSIPTG